MEAVEETNLERILYILFVLQRSIYFIQKVSIFVQLLGWGNSMVRLPFVIRAGIFS